MKKVKRFIFWCEFPQEVNWKQVNRLIDFPTEIYITAHTKQEFFTWKKKITNKNITVGVWPILTKHEGYWFSGYTEKKAIDKLKQFQGINMKIDIEPPIIAGKYNIIKLFIIYSKMFLFTRQRNKKYLHNTIDILSKKGKVIISGFAGPQWVLGLYGDTMQDNKKVYKNSFNYSTLMPKLAYYYPYKYYIKKTIQQYEERALFAVGCIGHGIFGNEPTYTRTKELEKDIQFLIKNNVKNIAIFDLAGIMNKKNPPEWINTIKKYI